MKNSRTADARQLLSSRAAHAGRGHRNRHRNQRHNQHRNQHRNQQGRRETAL
jgi:hypothetical protein